jgi:hypothetical protein
MRKPLVAGMAALLFLMIAAAPASAKKHPPDAFDSVATIDCGHGPMRVGSGLDTASPFVDLKTGKRYLPVEWHVAFGDTSFDEVIPNRYKGRRLVCSYDDGFATGTVTVVKENSNKP